MKTLPAAAASQAGQQRTLLLQATLLEVNEKADVELYISTIGRFINVPRRHSFQQPAIDDMVAALDDRDAPCVGMRGIQQHVERRGDDR
jgi:hypothetical protein